MYPTGILKNMETSRFHPISFRPAPMPSGAAPRYKSLGHHTDGFDTLDGAEDWISGNDNCLKVQRLYEWWPADIPLPALTDFFGDDELKNPADRCSPED